ncbi:MAG: imidazolonepropionase [Phycisphaerales bacterium]|nr:imidazolonepropionase [Phycisphaerales bacterium]
MSIGILNARVLTMSDAALGVRPCASVLIEGDRIAFVEPGTAGEQAIRRAAPRTLFDAAGRVLMPGFIDCHTHACCAGQRLDEWLYQRRNQTYLDVLAAGGGIMSTVRAVRAATQDQLTESLLERLDVMLGAGTTTVEIKSGYGLSTEAELKMLRAVRDAAAHFPGTLIPTALLGHAIDPEFPGGAQAFVEHTIRHTLPTVSREFPGIAIDAYCEKGAWSVAQCVRLFEAAKRLGHPIRVHADQFNALGMTAEAIRLGALSVDHLEASTPNGLLALANSPTFGVILPICGLHVDDRYTDARALLDATPHARLAIATNHNPGSAPSGSMPLAIALAVRKCGLWPAEALFAATAAPAQLLGLADRARIAPGLRADLLLLRHRDERQLAYELATPHIDTTICAGQVIE